MIAADLTFLTPAAGLFALTAAVPLAIFYRRSRRAGSIRRAIGLGDPGWKSLAPIVACLAAVPVLLGVASAQPVVGTTRAIPERVDAEVFFVLDTSRSMLASKNAGSPTRFARAQDIAEQLRDRIPQVPSGIVSMTDRLLPHVFPTTDRRVFVATLRQSIGVELPPPQLTYNTQATWLGILAGIPERHYFPKSATKRVLVVLTDAESRPFGPELSQAFQSRPRIQTVFVHVWGGPDERIYETGVAEGGYRSQPSSTAAIRRAADLVRGRAFDESEVSAAGDELVRMAGQGDTRKRTIAGSRLALMPYFALAAFLPLSFLLWRRNR